MFSLFNYKKISKETLYDKNKTWIIDTTKIDTYVVVIYNVIFFYRQKIY